MVDVRPAGDELDAAKMFVTRKKNRVMSKSEAAKKAAAGDDMGKPGKGFDAGVKRLIAKGYTSERARKIMGAQFQKMRRAGKL
jgi:hypothetical protein